MHVDSSTASTDSPIGSIETEAATRYRTPVSGDASALHALVRASPPLDLNSTYAYLLIGLHFAGTSVVAEHEGHVVGMTSAYLKPSEPDVLFVWQAAVHESARGLGVAKGMLRFLLARPACAGVRAIETTITPSNEASWRLFRAFAREMHADLERVAVFDGPDVGGHSHEEERLIRIAPVSPVSHGGT